MGVRRDRQLGPSLFSSIFPSRRGPFSRKPPGKGLDGSVLGQWRSPVTCPGTRDLQMAETCLTRLCLQVRFLLHSRGSCPPAAHTPVPSQLSSRCPAGRGMGAAGRRGRGCPLPGLCPCEATLLEGRPALRQLPFSHVPAAALIFADELQVFILSRLPPPCSVRAQAYASSGPSGPGETSQVLEEGPNVSGSSRTWVEVGAAHRDCREGTGMRLCASVPSPGTRRGLNQARPSWDKGP